MASRAARRGRDPGAHPHPVVRGLGGRGLRPERARVHPGRASSSRRSSRGSTRRRWSSTPGGGGGVRRDDPSRASLWVSRRRGAQPLALPPARRRRRTRRRDTVALSPRAAAVVGWCGMRGIVTLAAALALPTGGRADPPFPYRDLVLFTAFAVVLGTLVVQGMTLRPAHERCCASRTTARSSARCASRASRRCAPRSPCDDRVPGDEMSRSCCGAGTSCCSRAPRRSWPADDRAGRRAWQAPAARVSTSTPPSCGRRPRRSGSGSIALRADGTIGDAAFQRVEQELDLEELDLQQHTRPMVTIIAARSSSSGKDRPERSRPERGPHRSSRPRTSCSTDSAPSSAPAVFANAASPSTQSTNFGSNRGR